MNKKIKLDKNITIDSLLNTLQVDKNEIPICIETGTYQGQGTLEFSSFFKKVYTIELSKSLFLFCKNHYELNNVEFFNGKSNEVLKDIINKVDSKYFLFLDAHGSGGITTYDQQVGRYGSPVLEELDCCINKPPEYIVIDDLNCFIEIDTYPRVETIIKKINEIGNYEQLNLNFNMLIFKRIYE